MEATESIELKVGLPPFVSPGTRILILGSLPSDESIRVQQYYANPDNHFWAIVCAAFGGGDPDAAYCDRLAFLDSVGIGLWDVLESAERQGSADSAIRNETPNDIIGLLAQYPQIEAVLANGTKARDCFQKHFKSARLHAMYVPSSSPTPGQYVLPVEERITRWRAAAGPFGLSNHGIDSNARR